MKLEPLLTTATLINHVVRDMLFQHKFAYAHFPELVDLAVVGMGLGMLQSKIGFVKSTGSFWDSTQWNFSPRPFLDCQALAYANALAAWVRDDNDPEWANELPAEVKRPMRKSLKYLFKAQDSYFGSAEANESDRSQTHWLKLATNDSPSKRLIAIRHLAAEKSSQEPTQDLLLKTLRSGERAIILNSVDAVERLHNPSESIVSEIQLLVENRDEEIQAKALCTLTNIGMLDEPTVALAGKMLDSRTRFVVFAGVFALSTLDSVPDQVITAANRGISRALQSCDYEFVGLFTSAFNRWLKDPEQHFENLLEADSPEYLQIALEALTNIRTQSVALS